jgi:hypothetical protein
MPGNWFSGRRRRGAAKCAATDSIPLTFLRRKNMMPLKYWPGPRYMTMSWTMRGQETGSIGVYTHEDCMRLKYSVNGEAVEQVIEWGWTNNPFGKRRWFVCPKCWRNCSVLYGGERFYCRKCWGLTYHSQYEEDWERLSSKAERLRHRLGGKGFISAGDPFDAPPKPKWMRWATYRAICEKGDRLCFQYAMGFERRCSAMFHRFDRKGVRL